ncbi:hypothetical protein QVD17_27673 [Tagetes erecta]|uniref:Disease resistance R13L4/SHOC-2-like LRR domain-containing protein n=1 Tax=Tagetes erecta TaxID=13708 RepID=A0AAD8K9G8_TARER|nr:hypothetical protein QVD17_27673 [Tagetes erecta]
MLDLEGCNHLQDVHAPVGCLEYISYLNLCGCWRFEQFVVEELNILDGLISVTELKLKVESPDICPVHPNSNLPKFQFNCEYTEPLPSTCRDVVKLISLGLCVCPNLESFSASVCSLQQLPVLTLKGSIPEVPKDLYRLQFLWRLTLSMKEIKYLPDSICMLKRLKCLKLESCWLLERLPVDLGRLEGLEVLYLTGCISLRDIPTSICNMKCLNKIYLNYCILLENLPKELGCLECLKVLNIRGAYSLSRLPLSIYQLKGLHSHLIYLIVVRSSKKVANFSYYVGVVALLLLSFRHFQIWNYVEFSRSYGLWRIQTFLERELSHSQDIDTVLTSTASIALILRKSTSILGLMPWQII